MEESLEYLEASKSKDLSIYVDFSRPYSPNFPYNILILQGFAKPVVHCQGQTTAPTRTRISDVSGLSPFPGKQRGLTKSLSCARFSTRSCQGRGSVWHLGVHTSEQSICIVTAGNEHVCETGF